MKRLIIIWIFAAGLACLAVETQLKSDLIIQQSVAQEKETKPEKESDHYGDFPFSFF